VGGHIRQDSELYNNDRRDEIAVDVSPRTRTEARGWLMGAWLSRNRYGNERVEGRRAWLGASCLAGMRELMIIARSGKRRAVASVECGELLVL